MNKGLHAVVGSHSCCFESPKPDHRRSSAFHICLLSYRLKKGLSYGRQINRPYLCCKNEFRIKFLRRLLGILSQLSDAQSKSLEKRNCSETSCDEPNRNQIWRNFDSHQKSMLFYVHMNVFPQVILIFLISIVNKDGKDQEIQKVEEDTGRRDKA